MRIFSSTADVLLLSFPQDSKKLICDRPSRRLYPRHVGGIRELGFILTLFASLKLLVQITCIPDG